SPRRARQAAPAARSGYAPPPAACRPARYRLPHPAPPRSTLPAPRPYSPETHVPAIAARTDECQPATATIRPLIRASAKSARLFPRPRLGVRRDHEQGGLLGGITASVRII